MCSSCGAGRSVAYSRPRQAQAAVVNTDCIYTLDVLTNWENKLNCIKTQNLYSNIQSNPQEINAFLGVVKSAINTGNYCYFENHLNTIAKTIMKIINLGEC